MSHITRNIVLTLLILALFLGGTVEISEGSKTLGILWLLIALAAISRLKISDQKIDKVNLSYIFVGTGIIVSDIIFNLAPGSKVGTLDIMTLLFGASLIALGVNNNDVRRMGLFTSYMSATFLVLFLIFFSLFGYLNINFTHYFDHYFILIPVVFILNFFNIPVEVVGTETIHMAGVEHMSVVIGGPCSGLYSMFLLLGIVIGFTRLEKLQTKKVYPMLLITIVVAYISNLLRVTILYVVGFFYGSNTMMFIHTHLGWVIFVIVAGILMFILNEMALKKN